MISFFRICRSSLTYVFKGIDRRVSPTVYGMEVAGVGEVHPQSQRAIEIRSSQRNSRKESSSSHTSNLTDFNLVLPPALGRSDSWKSATSAPDLIIPPSPTLFTVFRRAARKSEERILKRVASVRERFPEWDTTLHAIVGNNLRVCHASMLSKRIYTAIVLKKNHPLSLFFCFV